MDEERYVTVDLAILQALRELDQIRRYDWHTLPTITLLLRVARVDEVSGQMVIGIRLARDLNPPEPERGLGSI